MKNWARISLLDKLTLYLRSLHWLPIGKSCKSRSRQQPILWVAFPEEVTQGRQEYSFQLFQLLTSSVAILICSLHNPVGSELMSWEAMQEDWMFGLIFLTGLELWEAVYWSLGVHSDEAFVKPLHLGHFMKSPDIFIIFWVFPFESFLPLSPSVAFLENKKLQRKKIHGSLIKAFDC